MIFIVIKYSTLFFPKEDECGQKNRKPCSKISEEGENLKFKTKIGKMSLSQKIMDKKVDTAKKLFFSCRSICISASEEEKNGEYV